jgi:preprotein translocase SecE subunit
LKTLSQLEKEKKDFSVTAWLQNLKDEVAKVSWTEKEELFWSTKLVVVAIFLLGFGIYLVDLFIKGSLEILKILFHLIF